MKKIVLVSLICMTCFVTYAQPQLGLVVGPSISMNQVKYKSDPTLDISKDGSKIRFKFGLEADFELTEKYSFSTGLFFAPKRAGFTVSPTDGSASFTEEYKIHYLQLPVTLKLFTQEIQPDLKAYFQLGFKGEIKIFDEPFREEYTLVDEFQFFDCSFTGGVGVEYGAGVNTVLYGGIFYDRGLVDVVKSSSASSSLVNKMSMLDLKIGLKF